MCCSADCFIPDPGLAELPMEQSSHFPSRSPAVRQHPAPSARSGGNPNSLCALQAPLGAFSSNTRGRRARCMVDESIPHGTMEGVSLRLLQAGEKAMKDS